MGIGVTDLIVSSLVFLSIHLVLVNSRLSVTSNAEHRSCDSRVAWLISTFCFEYVSYSSTFGNQTTEITLLKLKMSLVNRPLLLIFQYLSICLFLSLIVWHLALLSVSNKSTYCFPTIARSI